MNCPDNHTTFLNQLLLGICNHGPTRVVIDKEGEAISPKRARERHIDCDVIFLRADGWSLGAPKQFLTVAEEMWKDEWVGVTYAPFKEVIPYVSST